MRPFFFSTDHLNISAAPAESMTLDDWVWFIWHMWCENQASYLGGSFSTFPSLAPCNALKMLGHQCIFFGELQHPMSTDTFLYHCGEGDHQPLGYWLLHTFIGNCFLYPTNRTIDGIVIDRIVVHCFNFLSHFHNDLTWDRVCRKDEWFCFLGVHISGEFSGCTTSCIIAFVQLFMFTRIVTIGIFINFRSKIIRIYTKKRKFAHWAVKIRNIDHPCM